MSKEERWALPLPGWTRTCRNDYVMMMMMMMMRRMMMMISALCQHDSRVMSAL
jgi:hypothetical protein